MNYPPDSLCRYIREEKRYETMEELAINIERERNGLPPRVLNSRRVTAAQEAARMERWIKRVPIPVAPVEPPPPRRKHVKRISPETLMERMVEEFRRSLIKTVIASEGGNQCKAAKVLGVHRNTINRIINSRLSA